MSRYHFHLETKLKLLDQAGSEHPDLASAKRHAVKLLADSVSVEPRAFLGDRRLAGEGDRPNRTDALHCRDSRYPGSRGRSLSPAQMSERLGG